MRVRSILILLLHKLEVVGSLVCNHPGVLPATVNNVTKPFPRVFLHEELGGNILHLHHLCTVWKAVHSHHAHCQAARWRHKHLNSKPQLNFYVPLKGPGHKIITIHHITQKDRLCEPMLYDTPPFPDILLIVTEFDPLDSMHSPVHVPHLESVTCK